MTVDLDMMLEMRDLQVAMDVNRKAEMGYFDVEFTFYGCSYLKSGIRYYRLSAAAEKIFDFIAKSRINGCMTSNIMRITRKYPVPIGMKEYIAQDVKIELGELLEKNYSSALFTYLEKIAEQAEEQTAIPLLMKIWHEEIEGCFNSEKIQRFEMLLDYMYECRKLTTIQYQHLVALIVDEKKSMENDPEAKDVFEKTFYGIVYEKNGKLEYWDNAGKATIYRKKNDLESEGIFVSPIFEKRYWYNYTKRLRDVHKLFVKEMADYMDADYFNQVREICGQNHLFSKNDMEYEIEYAKDNFGEMAAETLRRYAIRWGIFV